MRWNRRGSATSWDQFFLCLAVKWLLCIKELRNSFSISISWEILYPRFNAISHNDCCAVFFFFFNIDSTLQQMHYYANESSFWGCVSNTLPVFWLLSTCSHMLSNVPLFVLVDCVFFRLPPLTIPYWIFNWMKHW